MPIWIKLKVFAPSDKIRNVGTRYQRIDGKRVEIDPKGSLPFAIKKGSFQPIPYEWDTVFGKDKETGNKVVTTPGLKEAQKKFDPAIFDFFKSKSEAAKQCKKEEKLLKMLPIQRLEAKQKRVREKSSKAHFKNRPTMDDVIREAKKIGVDGQIQQ